MYPDVQAFMATYRKAEAVVEQYCPCSLTESFAGRETPSNTNIAGSVGQIHTVPQRYTSSCIDL